MGIDVGDRLKLSEFQKACSPVDESFPPCSSTGLLSDETARHYAAPEWTDEQLVEKALEELIESVPSAKHAKVVRSVVHRIPMAIPRTVVGTELSRPVAGAMTCPVSTPQNQNG